MSQSADLKKEVEDFWNSEACGERYGENQDAIRYRFEPEIRAFAKFPSSSGQRVLEIGVGMGSDFLNFVRAGALATGVDLTDRAVRITAQRLADEGLAAELKVSDAENLPFPSATFDIVYSWGVLHHTPDTSKAVKEAMRVLAPGGQLRVMLYHRHSWLALVAWIRFCLLKGRPFGGLREAVSHVESPGTKAFTRDELRAMISGLEDVSVRPRLTHWDRKYAPGLATMFGDRYGWFLLAEGRKPVSGDV